MTDDRFLVRALREPRGRYTVTRASQLSGVPKRTLYDWAASGVVVPDFDESRPKQWSYRDLVLLRMMAWLRSHGMARPIAIERVDTFRDEFSRMPDGVAFAAIRSDGRSVFRGDSDVDDFTGQALLDGSFLMFLDEFVLKVPIEVPELGRRRLWGPDLRHPANRTYIDPWVMGGDPCIDDTRIPTSSLHALATQRGLTPSAIVDLYQGAISEDDVATASLLERSLQSHRKLAA